MSAPDKSKSHQYFPLAGVARDGWSNEHEASATCFCGAVQLSVPIEKPGLADVFICNCSDCHKLTASLFATNFTALDSHVKHLRGEDNLTTFAQSTTVESGFTMTNYFCKTCGSLLYRVGAGFPGVKILRVGTLDDFGLLEEKFKPRIEQFGRMRPSWLKGAEGVEQHEGNYYLEQAQKKAKV